MSKLYLSCFLLLPILVPTFGQTSAFPVDTLYVGKDYDPVSSRQEASYFRLQLKSAELLHGTVRYYYLDGNLAAEGHYQKGIREGEFVLFHRNGNVKAEGYCLHDYQVGKWQWWYPNGKLKQIQYYSEEAPTFNTALVQPYQLESFWDSTGRQMISEGTGDYYSYYDNGQLEGKGQFLDGYRHGYWTGNHESGKLYYQEEWQKGELQSGKSYSEEGQTYQYQEESVMPSYPGELPGLQRYLAHTLRYPSTARRARIQGEVRVAFIVSKDGSITDARVIQRLGAGCDEEALRVVLGMSRWRPGLLKGQPVSVDYILPIRFVLQ